MGSNISISISISKTIQILPYETIQLLGFLDRCWVFHPDSQKWGYPQQLDGLQKIHPHFWKPSGVRAPSPYAAPWRRSASCGSRRRDGVGRWSRDGGRGGFFFFCCEMMALTWVEPWVSHAKCCLYVVLWWVFPCFNHAKWWFSNVFRTKRGDFTRTGDFLPVFCIVAANKSSVHHVILGRCPQFLLDLVVDMLSTNTSIVINSIQMINSTIHQYRYNQHKPRNSQVLQIQLIIESAPPSQLRLINFGYGTRIKNVGFHQLLPRLNFTKLPS